ncbi:MAG: hypothetical protein A2252_09065 [Elusimicrobia bacterium RIFOXYA2_FULL_39_19]|nr:MAG: hypothetical protein A2252_09065 [Elusimicrobia bacterium RIFOXYA2_FULL_39_19]
MYCIDASVIVNSFFPKESNYQYSSKLINSIRVLQKAVYLPEIILPEISSAIARGTNDSALAIEFVEQILTIPTFNFIPIDREISFLAAEIASKYRLKGADSIYVATAKYFDVPLITLDLDQKEKASPLIDVFTPKEIASQL